jgi:hypothetical protein
MIESEIIIRQETAGRFGVSNSNGRVDLAELAADASRALRESDEALDRVRAIDGENWVVKWLNSGEIRAEMVRAIEHIRTIARVNVALSAICNDLAASNLEHAKTLCANQERTAKALNDIHVAVDQIFQRSSIATRQVRVLSSPNESSPDVEGAGAGVQSLQTQLDLQCDELARISSEVDSGFHELRRLEEGLRSDLEDLRGTTTAAKDAVVRRIRRCESRIDDARAELNALTKSFRSIGDALEVRLAKCERDLIQADAFSRDSLRRIGERVESLGSALKSMRVSNDTDRRKLKAELGSELRRMMKAGRVDLLTACAVLLVLQLIGIGFVIQWAGLR